MLKSTIALRILFAALVLVLPLTLAARKLVDDEPYPGLYLPNFGPVLEQGDNVQFASTAITAVLTDGGQVPIDGNAILSSPGGYSVTLGRYLADAVKANEETRQWLRVRLAAGYPDLDIAAVNVVSNTWEYDDAANALTIVGSTISHTIDLGGPS